MKNNGILIRMIVALAIYFGLAFFGGEIGAKILYPFRLLVTFLHELGHGLGAIITGGSVEGIHIGSDGSGYCKTAGGNRAIVLMGGYLGSAILGNLLFFIGAKAPRLAQSTIVLLAGVMIFVAFYWQESGFTFWFLVGFAVALILVANFTNWDREVLMFLGLATIVYIIQDFNVGPTSDLNKYAELLKVIPANVWMYIWLIIAILLTVFNLRLIFNKSGQSA